jgi:hypothetical protein
MANVLPKIINNDPEDVTISSTAQSVASDEFEFIVNGSNNSAVINSVLAESVTNAAYASSNVDLTIIRSGKYTLHLSSFFGSYTLEVAPDGINYFIVSSGSGTFNLFLNAGAKVKTTGNPGFAISGAAEGYTNATYILNSSSSFESSKYTRSAYKNIT